MVGEEGVVTDQMGCYSTEEQLGQEAGGNGILKWAEGQREGGLMAMVWTGTAWRRRMDKRHLRGLSLFRGTLLS